ncbi:MAG: signal peptidase I [bacterium]
MRVTGVVREVVIFVLLAVVIVLPIRFFIAQPFVVQGESMHPTFENGDYLIIDELSYDFSAPRRGDVVVFRYPGDTSVFYIKRIIGLPGETVRITKGVVNIQRADGSDLALESEPYISAEDATYTLSTSLGQGEYFVMGDNRPNSSDSRVWGTLPEKDIMGRVFLRLLPASAVGAFPGAASVPQ